MRMELDQFVNELSERKTTLRTDNEARFGLDHRHAAPRARPGAADAKRQGSRLGDSGPVNEALSQTTFEMLRERHLSPFAGEFAIRVSLESIAAFRAVHSCPLSG